MLLLRTYVCMYVLSPQEPQQARQLEIVTETIPNLVTLSAEDDGWTDMDLFVRSPHHIPPPRRQSASQQPQPSDSSLYGLYFPISR